MSDVQPAAPASVPEPRSGGGHSEARPDSGGPAGVLAALALAHLATLGMALSGPVRAAVVVALVVDVVLVLALGLAAGAAAVRGSLPPAVVAGLLVAAGVAAGVRAAATGEPLMASTAALVALTALVVPGVRLLAACVTVVAGTAVTGAGVAAARTGDWADAGLTATLVVGAALTTLVLYRSTAAQAEAAEAARRAAEAHQVDDALTGVRNRRGLELMAQQMIERARRGGEAVHALFVDVDGFSAINDELGWDGGDGVLVAVAEALVGSARATDVVCRIGGDEFVVLGPGTGTSPLELERRVRAILTETPPVPGSVWPAALSIGSATLVPWDDGDLGSLVARADQDMRLRRSLRRQSRDRRGDLSTPRSEV